MVKVPTLSTSLLFAAAGSISATKINFVNKCSTPVQLYHSERFQAPEKLGDIAPGSSLGRDVNGQAHMFHHGFSTDATLAEFSMPGDGKAWFDISVIPPMPGHCRSFEDCKAVTGKRGFNVPMSISPKQNANGRNCRSLMCAADDKALCADAYHFPDDIKTHDCPASTEFDVVFCPNGGGGNNNNGASQQQAQPQATSKATASSNNNQSNNNQSNSRTIDNNKNNGQFDFGTTDLSDSDDKGKMTPGLKEARVLTSERLRVRTTFSYKGREAGNVLGSYNRVMSLRTCERQRVLLHSPVGPLSEEVSLVFRGPMEIYNIAVFDGSSEGGTFKRVSSYARDGGEPENLVFMNNRNIDYSGQQRHGPQGFAGADGVSTASEPTKLNGVLQDASSSGAFWGGPGATTGAEVNIMTGEKCDGACVGFHGDNDYHGWGGGRKVFVTEVQMPHSTGPDLPAILMFNAQVLHSGMYGCNCRGMGRAGGCGELDIAEVSETNANRDRVTTHYYFYDGALDSSRGDNFAARPDSRKVSYATIIDDRDGGLVKIVEVEDFDFSQEELSASVYDQFVYAS